MEIFNSEKNSLPFEFVSETCSKKKLTRLYSKCAEFLSYVESLKTKSILDYNFYLPIFLFRLEDYLDKDNLKNFINSFDDKVAGYIVYLESYKYLNSEKIVKYNFFVNNTLKNKDMIHSTNGHPIDILLAYEIGIVYNELAYPFLISEEGTSLDIQIDLGELHENTINIDFIDDVHLDKSEMKTINLNEETFRDDHKTLLEGCNCFTCINKYTRAYIHHLLKCNELNGPILLIL